MPPFLAELLGTMLLVILGDGVVANVVLNKTKGQSGGWIVITAGWAFAVTIAVYAVGPFSGGPGHPPGAPHPAPLGPVPAAAGARSGKHTARPPVQAKLACRLL